MCILYSNGASRDIVLVHLELGDINEDTIHRQTAEWTSAITIILGER